MRITFDAQRAAIILTMAAFNIQRSFGSKRSVRYYKQPHEPSTIAQDGCAVRCSVEYSDIKAAGVMIASNSCTCTEFGIDWVLTAPMNTIPGNQYFTKTALKHEFNPAIEIGNYDVPVPIKMANVRISITFGPITSLSELKISLFKNQNNRPLYFVLDFNTNVAKISCMIGGNWCFESGDKIETTFVGLKTKNHTVGINISNTGLIKIQIDDDALPQYRNQRIDPADTRSIRVASDVESRLYSIEFLEL